MMKENLQKPENVSKDSYIDECQSAIWCLN